MTGTKYIMGKDMPPLTPAAPTKVCKRCNIEKPNNFLFFGKKHQQTRTNFVTVDICKDCVSKKLSDTANENARKKHAYEVHRRGLDDERAKHLLKNFKVKETE